jgi:thioester reductase-like protein
LLVVSDHLRTEMKKSDSEIRDFYNGRHVFVTGGSGFLGKVLIEKLLRCCPEIGSIHVLIRPRNNQSAEQRIEHLLRNQIFNQIRNDQSEQLIKVIAVIGDVTSDNLGISFNQLIDLIPKISVVIHSAATIRFDEPLKRAIDINVGGTARVVKFCKRLDNLHVRSRTFVD